MKSISLIQKLRIIQIAMACLVVTVTTVYILRPRAVPKEQLGSASVKAQRALSDVRAHLGGVSLAMMAYLQTQKPEFLERIKAGGEAATQSLNDYKIASQTDSSRDLVQIDARFETLRAATLAVLKADVEERQARAQIEERGKVLDRLFSKNLLPSLRPDQIGGFVRLGLLRAAEKESLALLGPAAVTTASEKRFHAAMTEFAGMTRGRLRESAREAIQEYSQAAALSRRMTERHQLKSQLLEGFEEANRQLDEALGTGSPLPMEISRDRLSWPWAIALLLGLACFVGLAVVMDLTLRRQFLIPLNQIAQIADSAAAGDLSREIDLWRRDEVGSLAQSLNRLLAVLSRSENLVYHLAALVECSGEAIISQTLDGTILSWNKGAQRQYGWSADEIKGRNISELTPDDGGARLRQVLEDVRAGKVVEPFDMVHRAKDGRQMSVLIQATAVCDSSRNVIGVSLVSQERGRIHASNATETVLASGDYQDASEKSKVSR